MKRIYLFKIFNKETKEESLIEMFLTPHEERAFVKVFKTIKEMNLFDKQAAIKIERYIGGLK